MKIGTKEVAKLLKVKPSYLQRAIWEGRLDEPPRLPNGRFSWDAASLEKACWRIHRQSLEQFTKGGGK